MRILKLVVKNLLRHKLRSTLTVLGIAIAVLAFGILRTMVSAWYAGVEASSADRLIVRQAVSFIFPLPLAYQDRIAKMPGVERVAYANWFGGTYIDKNQFFARLGVDDSYFSVYPEMLVPTDQFDTYLRERNACIIGSQLAERYHLKLGDIMTMEGDIYPGRWDFVVRGIYTPRDNITDPSTMLFHWQYLDERMKQDSPGRAGLVGWYVVQVKNPSQANAVAEEIDRTFANSTAETKTETERAFQADFLAGASAVITAMNIISFVIIGIILLILGNTMIMAARERVREYAVLKTLGFSAFHLTGLIAGESLLIACLGGVLGLVLTFPMAQGFASALRMFFPVFTVETSTVVLAAGVALIVGLVAAVFPIHRSLSTSIIDGLRQVG